MLRVLALAAVVGPALAWGCPTCSCANPALTTMGSEQPFDGRVRLAATVRAWAQRDGTPQVDEAGLRELRLDLTASWSPVARWTFLLNLPLQLRERSDVSLARERGFGPGEADLSVRFLLVGATGFRPRHLVSLVLNARLPTAPTLSDASGRVFELDAQLGPGAFVPGGGVFWSAFIGDQWSTFVSLTGDVPLTGRYGLRVGPGVGLLASAQYQPWHFLGFRAGVDARYEAVSFLSGVPSPELAGVLVQAAADVVVAPVSALLLSIGARVPFVDTRPGPVSTTPILLLSVVVDV
jgi:hypothetical protein